MQLLSGLQNKVVLITGGASGIGRACAASVVASGGLAVCADLQEGEPLPTGSVFERLDVTDWEMTQSVVARVLQQYGQIDGLVTSAGISAVGYLQQMDLMQWQRVLTVNLTGSMLSMRAVAAHMQQRGQGSMVAIASMNGMLGNPSNVAYCTSKAGVIQLVRSVAADVGRYGVRVNSISPGLIRTPMTAMLDAMPARSAFEKQHLLGRCGEAREVGDVAAFLLSDLASFITGVNLPVDGGFTAVKVIELF